MWCKFRSLPPGLNGEGHRWVPFGLGKHQLEGRDLNATGGPGIQDGTVGAVELNSRGTEPWTCCVRGVRLLAEVLMEPEVSEQVEAGRYERTPERKTYRNGYRERR